MGALLKLYLEHWFSRQGARFFFKQVERPPQEKATLATKQNAHAQRVA